MSDEQIYQLAKVRLSDFQQGIAVLVNAGEELPAEAFEMTLLYGAAIRWYEALHPEAPAR